MVANFSPLIVIAVLLVLTNIAVIVVYNRKLKAKQLELKSAIEHVAETEKRIISVKDDLAVEKRNIAKSARGRVRRLDLSSKFLIYNHLLDHLQRWKKGNEDLSVAGRFVRDSSDRLSRKVRDYWERVEVDTPENAQGLIPSLEEHLMRRIVVFAKELQEPVEDSDEGSLSSLAED